jgi:hypothetical protein
MVIGDEDGTSLDRGVDPVLKEWRRLWNVAAMWFGSAPAMERRGESGGGVQVGFKPMTPHSFSSAPAGSADFGGCYPLLSPTSFDWQRRRDRGPRGRHGVRAAAVRRFLLRSGKNRGRGTGERVRRHCAGGVTVLAAVTFMWRACGGAISEPLRIGADCYFFGDLLKSEACWRGRFRAGSYFFLDTGSYPGPAGDARAMIKRPT